jgi:Domain of unknown function (DUF4395)
MNSRVDQTALRFNQACIVTLVAIALVSGATWLVALLCLAMAIGTAWPALAPFKAIYQNVLRPAGLLRPSVIPDDPAPHRFAQGVGATFLLASTIALVLGLATAGWVLAAIVLVLAGINLTVGFCAGCFVYYQLGRLGLLPGRKSISSAGQP